MKSNLRILSVAVLFMAMSACSQHWGNLKTISTEAPAGTVVGSNTISGKECKFFSTMRTPATIEEALQNALETNPGTIGLKDVRIEFYRQTFLQYWCATVIGFPVTKK